MNADNVYLLNEMKYSSKIDPQLLKARYVYGLALIGIALLNEENGTAKNGEKESDEEVLFDTIKKVTKSVSTVLLPMIAALGDLNISKQEDLTLDEILKSDPEEQGVLQKEESNNGLR